MKKTLIIILLFITFIIYAEDNDSKINKIKYLTENDLKLFEQKLINQHINPANNEMSSLNSKINILSKMKKIV